MPSFDMNFRPDFLLPNPHSIFADIAREAWRPPAPMDGAGFAEILKHASNVEFSTPQLNSLTGQQPDFFVDQLGRMTKNPNAHSNPGDPLNIEFQFNGEQPNDRQKSVLQNIIDTFLSSHPDAEDFPRTWQDVFDFLRRRMERAAGNQSPQESYEDSSYGDQSGGGGGRCYGGDGGGSGGGGGRDRSRHNHNDRSMPRAPRWDGKSKGDMTLAGLAESALGSALWAETEFAGVCQGGNVGCAASVSRVLGAGGYDYANSAGVVELARQLGTNGWTQSGLDGAQPGDVILGDGGGDHQHIGIVGVGDDGQLVIYNNHSSDGLWHKDAWNDCSIISDYSPDQVTVLHAPGGKTPSSGNMV